MNIYESKWGEYRERKTREKRVAEKERNVKAGR